MKETGLQSTRHVLEAVFPKEGIMSTAKLKKASARHGEKRERLIFHLMLLPGMIVLALFVFVPLVGSLMAFQNYKIGLGLFGSPWVGLENYRIIFTFPDSIQVFWNTLVIAFGKLVLNAVIPVAFSILLNELGGKIFKRAFQTVVYLPHFLSWVVLATVVTNMFSLDGPINSFLNLFGIGGIVLCVPTLSVFFKLLRRWTDSSLRSRGLPEPSQAYAKGQFPRPTAGLEDNSEKE